VGRFFGLVSLILVFSPLFPFPPLYLYRWDLLTAFSCSTSHDQKIVVLDFAHDIEGAAIFM
jgi:hypothetical protein